jgi:aminoglycoside 6'-N-acetyltransferase
MVTLRPVGPDDAGALGNILEDPTVAPWWGTYDAEKLRRDVIDPPPEVASFVIEVEGSVAGFIQYSEENEPDYRHAGIDIAVASFWQGRGIGPDAIRTLACHLFEERGHHRLTIDPAAANDRAIRAYERVGFRRVGIMRAYEQGPDGLWHDGLLMDLLRGELRP